MASRLLIVDDDTVVRETLLIAMEEERFEITAAASAEEGLAAWRPGEFAVLVVDKNLPGKSGIDFIREVRAEDEAVGILMITGYGSVQTALDTLHLGIDGYLEKPFEDIFEVVRDIGEAGETGERRRRAATSEAASHFARATEHLAAIRRSDRRPQHVLLAAGPETAQWLQQRLPGTDLEVVSEQAEILERISGRWDLLFVEADVRHDPVVWLEQVRERAPDVPCVVVCARPTFDVVKTLIRLRVGAVLEEPLTDRQFEQRVEPMLKRLWPRAGGGR